jgi:hypothetical protein
VVGHAPTMGRRSARTKASAEVAAGERHGARSASGRRG